MKDPITRTDSPYTDPSVKGPSSKRLAQGHPPAANSMSWSTVHLAGCLEYLVADICFLSQ